MGKPTFWGISDRVPPRRRHSYVKHQLGEDEVYVKLPNIEKMKEVILARKLLYMNYVFGEHGNQNRKTDYIRLEHWDDMLEVRKTERRFKLREYNKRHLRVKRKRSQHNSNDSGETNSAGETLQSVTNMDMDDGGGGETIMTDTLINFPSTSTSIYEDEEWQRKHFVKRMLRDVKSNNVSEILCSRRMAAVSSKEVSFPPTRTIMLMEIAREASYLHDWRRVSKCLQGLSMECVVTDKTWLIWNCGFLTFVNLCPNQLMPLIEFAKNAKKLLTAYPRSYGIELATWFTQKGHFTNGICILQDWHELEQKYGHYMKKSLVDNPKRYMVDMIALLYEAVFHYLSFKRDVEYFEEEKYEGDEDSLYRSGERALALFENVLDLGERIDAEVTIFLEPLIELVIKFRGEDRAKEVFDRIMRRNYRHAFLDELYIKFLKEYFPQLEQEINERESKYSRFDFTIDEANEKEGNIRLRNWLRLKKRQVAAEEKPPSFQKLEKPGFSW